MPRGDGTGPAGQGPMTGRRLGSCVDGIRRFFGTRGEPRSNTPSDASYSSGRQHLGQGAGRGRGRRRTNDRSIKRR